MRDKTRYYFYYLLTGKPSQKENTKAHGNITSRKLKGIHGLLYTSKAKSGEAEKSGRITVEGKELHQATVRETITYTAGNT